MSDPSVAARLRSPGDAGAGPHVAAPARFVATEAPRRSFFVAGAVFTLAASPADGDAACGRARETAGK